MSLARVVTLAGCAMLCGCPPPVRDVPPPDAEAVPLCGNGTQDISNYEVCDEGANNGRPDSYCSKQCESAVRVVPGPLTNYIDLGAPLLHAISLESNWVTTLGVDGAVHVWGRFVSGPDNPKLWRVSANAVALGRFPPWGFGPVWIEMSPGPRLYAVDRRESVQTPTELPYPFPDGIRPEILEPADQEDGIVIVDENAAGELLIAVLIPTWSSPEVATYTLRVPAPSGQRGVVIDSGYGRARMWGNGVRNLVVFYDQPGSFVSVNIRYDRFPAGNDASGPLSLSENTRGSWPYRVRSGALLDKSCDSEPYWPFTNPIPIATVTDSGTIFVWQFDRSLPGGETFVLKPFAQVQPGTISLRSNGGGILDALQPDGRLIRFTDGDCLSLESNALVPVAAPYVPAASNNRLPHPGLTIYPSSGQRLYYE